MTERPFAFDPHPPAYATPLPASVPAPDDTQIPGPPPMPTGTGADGATTLPPPEPLEEIRGRLHSLEDALLDPRGILCRLVTELDRKAAARHEEAMRTFTALRQTLDDVISNQLEGLERLNRLEPQVETNATKLRLIELEGHGHVANGSAE